MADLRAGVPDAKLPCDGCKYREIAHDLGHGHNRTYPCTSSGCRAVVHMHAATMQYGGCHQHA